MIKLFGIMKKKATLLVLTAVIATSCALPVPMYDESVDPRSHFPFEPESLNCTQLSQQVIRVQDVLSDIADRVTEKAGRSTASFTAGIESNNPDRGTNFFGFRSSAVDPVVPEFQETLILLEEIQVLLVEKCSSTRNHSYQTGLQPPPKG